MSRSEALTVIEHNNPLAPVSEVTAIVHMIERAARDPSVDIDKMQRLLEMHDRMSSQRAEQAFNEAMAAAQSEMRPVAADSNNPQTRSRYASYHALDRAMRPIYTKHGFALSFNTEPGAADGYIRVVCHVAQRGDGRSHTRRYSIDMPADGKGAKGGDVMTKTHAVGSGVTYGQRYLLKMIFNIAVGDDDDGRRAGETGDPISAEQVVAIQSLIVEVAADIPRFCKYMKVARIEEIKSPDFNRAVAALEAKRSAQ